MKLKSKCLFWILGIIILLLSLITIFYNKDVVIYVGSEKIVLANKDEKKAIDLNSLNSEFDTIIKEKSLFHKVKVNGEVICGDKNIGKVNIEKYKTLEIEVDYLFSDSQIYYINLLPSTFPSYTVKGKSSYEGDYYTSTFSFEYDGDHYIFKLDEEGKMLFYKKTNMVAFDFKKEVNSKGGIRYLYLEATAKDFDKATSLLPCHLVVLDEEYNEINRIKYLKSNEKKVQLENHGYIYLDDNHYILVGYETIVDNYEGNEYNVYDCIMQEVKNNEILWEFRSSDYKDLYKYSTLETLDYSVKFQDYIHFNSMDIDKKDNNLVVSFRNIDATLKINRTTGELMWILSGLGDEFRLTKKQKTSKQHSVLSLEGDKILLYDNGNINEKSRIVEYTLDEKNKKIIKFKEYDLGLYAVMMGSVRIIDEEKSIYLICYGGGGYRQNSIQEMNMKTGEVSFEFTFDTTRFIYNVNKYS